MDPTLPQKGQARAVRLLSVPDTHPITVCFLGPYSGLLTHFHGKRTLPCLGAEMCPQPIHRNRIIWKGYAPVDQWFQELGLYVPAVLEITEGFEHRLNGRNIRGEVWALSRLERKPNSPVVALFSERLPDQVIRPSFPIRSIVESCYHAGTLLLDSPNPIPPAIMMEPVAGTPPKILAEFGAANPEDIPVDPLEKERLRAQIRAMGTRGKGACNGTSR